MSLVSPLEVIELLKEEELFQEWKKNHAQSYLSHFFCPVNSELEPLGEWEIGWLDPDDEKITVFALLENGTFAIKPADEVFKDKNTIVEELDLDKVKVSVEEVQKTADESKILHFPTEILGNGFIILQTLNEVVQWNVSFITKTLKFANLKINAETGELFSHNVISFMETHKGQKAQQLQ
ncbi:hypothetical protein HZC30_02625 [Candidatus Woesearchaeota archaeon]|nr:hypothetical protein [Candidatus Woesearchaeota archaeon]